MKNVNINLAAAAYVSEQLWQQRHDELEKMLKAYYRHYMDIVSRGERLYDEEVRKTKYSIKEYEALLQEHDACKLAWVEECAKERFAQYSSKTFEENMRTHYFSVFISRMNDISDN